MNGVEGGEPSEEDPPSRSKSRAFESKVLLSIDSKFDGLVGVISDEALLDEGSCRMLSFETSQRWGTLVRTVYTYQVFI